MKHAVGSLIAIVAVVSPLLAFAQMPGGDVAPASDGGAAPAASSAASPATDAGVAPPPSDAAAAVKPPEPNADAGAAPAGDDDQLEMKFEVPKGAAIDMQNFSAQSENELKLGSARARYSLNVFGDTSFSITGGTGQKPHPSFGVGGFSMLFSGSLENGIRFTAEPNVEFAADNTPGIDLERLAIRYTHAPSGFWIEVGRTHTDFGYWNYAYHHGRWLQPTIDRPRAVQFEDDEGILPIHWVGAQIGITHPIGKLAITASVAVGNGHGSIVDDIQNGRDANPAKQVHGKLELKGLLHRDLRIGVSGSAGYISPQDATVRPALPNEGLWEIIGNAYVALPSYPLFFIAEAYLVSHRGDARTWQTYDAFAVLGYTFGSKNPLQFTPYVKGERIVMVDGLDPFFVPQNTGPVLGLDVFDATAGLRWDVSAWSAIKGEYRFEYLPEVQATTHTGTVAWQLGL